MKTKEAIEQYIAFRKSLGEKFKTNSNVLRSFIRIAGEDTDVSDLDEELCNGFLDGGKNEVTAGWFAKHSALKGFFQWMLTREYVSYIPLPTELPKRVEHHPPYIYSNDELRRLFRNALTYQTNRSATPPECIRMILMVDYMLGLRLHETVSLRLKDVDTVNRVAYIRESKFYKSRMCPFNKQVGLLLEGFMHWRTSQGMPTDPEEHLFLDKRKKHINIDTVRGCFQRIRDKAGILVEGDMQQPRIHDLRHTFSVNRLVSWYREGKDVQKLLPILSAYLGHKHIAHTSVYLKMTETLLGEANKRFENYAMKGQCNEHE